MKHDGYLIERDIEGGMLRQIISSIVSEYVAGAYAVPKPRAPGGATPLHTEASRSTYS